MRINGYIITIENKNIGPAHDPYEQRMMAIINESTGKGVALTHCSLSEQTVVRFYEGDNVVAGVKTKRQQCAYGIDALINEHVGLTPDEAEELYCRNYERDPMGELSDYI